MAKGFMTNSVDNSAIDPTELCRLMLNDTIEGIYFVDRNYTVTYWNNSAENITGIRADEVIGRVSTESILHPVTIEGMALNGDRSTIRGAMLDGKMRENEVNIIHRDGHQIPVLLRTIPIKKYTRIMGVLEVFVDFSNRQAILKQAKHYRELAYTDRLTRVPNRRYLDKFLKARHGEFVERGVPYGVMMLDIDHFKEFNDTYGHDLGDEVLKLVASSGEMMIRETDLFARFGGEEFIVVLVGTNSQNMMVVADAIRTVMQNTGIVHDGKTLQVTVSIGVTMARKDDTIDAVIKRADQMMYESKQQGRNRVSFG